MKDLSIVIVNWNTRSLLKDCLDSIYKNTKNISFEIIVVDNASIDDSVEMINQNFKDVILIKNDKNLGFAKANNIAFNYVNARYVILLNSDTLVLPNSFENVIEYMDLNDNVGIVTPKILNNDGTIQHPCYIMKPSWKTEIYYNFMIDRLVKNFDTIPADNTIRDVVHATGAALFIRKKTLDKIGYLDEKMIFTLEDADICIRSIMAGWKNVYFPNSEIIHLGGQSRSKLNDKGINAMFLSKYIFFKKYHKMPYFAAIVIINVASAIFRIVYLLMAMAVKRKEFELKKQIICYNLGILKWHLFSIQRFDNMEKMG